MAYSWNPLWHAVESSENVAYLASIQRMIMASINWLADHPGAKPKWDEKNRRALARAAGVADDIPLNKVAFIGAWEDFFRPTNDIARAWFAAIETACVAIGGKENAPTVHMFTKAVACGMLFRQEGWEGFDRFMSGSNGDETRQ